MKLTIVGCTGSMSGPDAVASSYLVQADDVAGRTWSVVLDLGPGAMGQLLRYLDPAELDAIAISHCHADHMVDLVGMHVYRRWNPAGCLDPVLTLGPGELLSRLNGVDGTSTRETYSTEFSFRVVEAGEAVRVGPLIITPFPALHPVDAFGYRVEGPGHDGDRVSLAFTGDTDLCEGIEAMADGVDLLLAEAAFLEGRDTTRGIHLTGRRAGQLAAGTSGRGGRRPAGRLVLTHIQPWTDVDAPLAEAAAVYGGPLTVATPGASWEL
ncbi:MBL fold metallo-hydrolase [Actinomyces qiguomingii]|uniref:MBL fold metallo-hydrolase n=1 Tax=Actinomyces qiguomingii TaxID=2057800 RepID=UPI000CA066C7|nr:MBL fold metallo-hydrolase [Actinomyces qiguomingii]